MLAVALENGIRAIDFLDNLLRFFPLENPVLNHFLVFRSRSHAHRVCHFVHGRAHEHVIAVLAKTEVAIAASLGSRNPRAVINFNMFREVGIFIIKENRRIHRRRNKFVSIEFILRRIGRLVQVIFNIAGKSAWQQEKKGKNSNYTRFSQQMTHKTPSLYTYINLYNYIYLRK